MISKNYSQDPVLYILKEGTLLECINLRKSLQERQLEEDKKKKDKQDNEDGNKDGTKGFQCNTRFTKGHKPSNHIHARIKSHVYTTE